MSLHAVPELYRLIREEIHFEHQQISSRLTWYLTSQSLLVAAFAGVASQRHLFYLLDPLAALGVSLSSLVLLGVQAAVMKIRWLRQRERQHQKERYFTGSTNVSTRFAYRLSLLFPYGTPVVFLVFWGWLLLRA